MSSIEEEDMKTERQVDIYLEHVRQARERRATHVLGPVVMENIDKVTEKVETEEVSE